MNNRITLLAIAILFMLMPTLGHAMGQMKVGLDFSILTTGSNGSAELPDHEQSDVEPESTETLYSDLGAECMSIRQCSPGLACVDGATNQSGRMISTGNCECIVGEACGDTCVETQSDPNHCGACNNACGEGEFCIEGACASSCEGEEPESPRVAILNGRINLETNVSTSPVLLNSGMPKFQSFEMDYWAALRNAIPEAKACLAVPVYVPGQLTTYDIIELDEAFTDITEYDPIPRGTWNVETGETQEDAAIEGDEIELWTTGIRVYENEGLGHDNEHTIELRGEGNLSVEVLGADKLVFRKDGELIHSSFIGFASSRANYTPRFVPSFSGTYDSETDIQTILIKGDLPDPDSYDSVYLWINKVARYTLEFNSDKDIAEYLTDNGLQKTSGEELGMSGIMVQTPGTAGAVHLAGERVGNRSVFPGQTLAFYHGDTVTERVITSVIDDEDTQLQFAAIDGEIPSDYDLIKVRSWGAYPCLSIPNHVSIENVEVHYDLLVGRYYAPGSTVFSPLSGPVITRACHVE